MKTPSAEEYEKFLKNPVSQMVMDFMENRTDPSVGLLVTMKVMSEMDMSVVYASIEAYASLVLQEFIKEHSAELSPSFRKGNYRAN